MGQAFGALIFTCNGRGRNLFSELSYDSRKVAEFIPVPSSGFLCNGKGIYMIKIDFNRHAVCQPTGVRDPKHCVEFGIDFGLSLGTVCESVC